MIRSAFVVVIDEIWGSSLFQGEQFHPLPEPEITVRMEYLIKH